MGSSISVKSWPDNFRYSGGDAVLRFSSQTSGILLLHSKSLSARSQVFKSMFSEQWTKPSLAAFGAQQVKYYEADLVLDYEDGFTYLQTNARQSVSEKPQRNLFELDHAGDSDLEELKKTKPATQFVWDDSQTMYPADSRNPTDITLKRYPYGKFRDPYKRLILGRKDPRHGPWAGWLRSPARDHHHIITYSLNIHKVLFSLVYGKSIELNVKTSTRKLAIFLADVATYADYYGILGAVRIQSEALVRLLKDPWKDICQNPRLWVGFTRLVLSEELFRDVMKHLVGQGLQNRDGGGGFPEDVYEVAAKLESEHEIKQVKLRSDLGNILSDKYCDDLPLEFGCQHPEAPAGEGADKIRQIVKGMFCSWLTHWIFTDRGFRERRYHGKRSSYWTVRCSYDILHRCAKIRDFDGLMRWHTLESVADMHHLEPQYLRNCIDIVFAQIERCFESSLLFTGHKPTSLSYDSDSCFSFEDPDQRPCTCHRARYEDDPAYFTYMSPSTDLLPEAIWRPDPPPQAPQPISTQPASREYQKCLGIDFGDQLPSEDWNELRHLKDILDQRATKSTLFDPRSVAAH